MANEREQLTALGVDMGSCESGEAEGTWATDPGIQLLPVTTTLVVLTYA